MSTALQKTSSVEPDQVPPLQLSVGGALLFTVVLSVRPSRIRRGHNPLFIPTVVQVVCKWTWVMADRERLASPAVRTRREPWTRQRETHVDAFSSQAEAVLHKQHRNGEKGSTGGRLLSIPEILAAL